MIAISLAVTYLTYLVTRSEFPLIEAVRVKIHERWEGGWQAYLSGCAWCASFYLAGLTVWGVDLAGSIPLPGIVWLGSATVAGVTLAVVDLVGNAAALAMKRMGRD